MQKYHLYYLNKLQQRLRKPLDKMNILSIKFYVFFKINKQLENYYLKTLKMININNK